MSRVSAIILLILSSINCAALGGGLKISPSFFGYNLGAVSANRGPWHDAEFNAAVVALRASSLRFPSGSAGNYWNWTLGCEMPCTAPGPSTLEDFAVTLRATNASVVLMLNMLTDTLESQISFLSHAESLGIPIEAVELGNEFYNAMPDYINTFTDGAAYGKIASMWVTAVRAAYPQVTLSVVGVPSDRSAGAANERLKTWNDKLFSNLVGMRTGDGVSMHEYAPSGAGSGKVFTKADVSIMLATPFANVKRISNAADALPSWASVWITEYNLRYNTALPDVPMYGTWAQGLYVATETLLMLNVTRIANGRINKHSLLSTAANGALFEDTASFNFAMSPNTKLPTTLYGRSAPGIALTLIGAASFQAKSATTITFSPNPVTPGGVDSLVGVEFSGSGGWDSAVIINLAPEAFKFSQSSVLSQYTAFEQVSIDDATLPVNQESDVAKTSGALTGTSTLSLPPYSVTRLIAAVTPPIALALSSTWSCSTGDITLNVNVTDFSYTISVAGIPWLEQGDAAIHYDGNPGVWFSAQSKSLTVSNVNTSSGFDNDLGSWTSLNISWSGAPDPFSTDFICYLNADTVEFRASWPFGTTGGISPGTFYTDAQFYNFNISSSPSAQFPSFKLGPDAFASSLGHIQWAGEFSFRRNNFNVSLEGFVGGSLGGPLLLHDPYWSRGSKPRAGVLGPLSNFKDVQSFIVPDINDVTSNAWRFVVGPHGHFEKLPIGFDMRQIFVSPRALPPYANTAVYKGDTGITAATYAYGAVLRVTAHTLRFAAEDDMGVSVLSAWTDNGQAYDGDYWGRNGNAGTAGDVFLALRKGFDDANIPIPSLQLDPYWFASGSPGNKDWLPSPSIFGAAGFNETITTFKPWLYSFMFAAENNFNSFKWVISPPWDNFMKGNSARISPTDSLGFYSVLMQRCVAWGCIGFEIDFLDMQFAGFPDVLATPGSFEIFLKGLSTAGANAGVPVQLCMPLASDVLASIYLHGVSNIRASDDNDLSYASADRWRIGLTSLLHGSIDIRPFMDGVWTVTQVDGYNYEQKATELGVVISTLSTGPIGIGDPAGTSNATFLYSTAAKNGVILKPSLPATPIDIYFKYGDTASPSSLPILPLAAARAELWSAPSFIPASPIVRGSLSRFFNLRRNSPRAGTFPNVTECPWMSILTIDIPSTTSLLLPTDLTPSLDICTASSGYVITSWSRGKHDCVDGSAATLCGQIFNASNGLNISAGGAPSGSSARGGPHNFDILSISPIFTAGNGWVLIGEVDKFVRVSPVRFAAVVPTGTGLDVYIDGAPNEIVYLTFLVPNSGTSGGSIVRVFDIPFNSKGGSCSLHCTGRDATASCVIESTV
jgi:hypothetical protein